MDKILILRKPVTGDDMTQRDNSCSEELRQGNDVLQELKDKSGEDGPDGAAREIPIPLFLGDSRDGDKGNAQDEKDETEE